MFVALLVIAIVAYTTGMFKIGHKDRQTARTAPPARRRQLPKGAHYEGPEL